ncbi:MAG: RNA polymerase sigma-70 factor (ECF subfamily) [Polaribacter sp.]|jgi:RNA polymerase sigma-70 factor (ECF subfamily)
MTDFHSQTDEQLIALLQTNSDLAIDWIFRRYYRMCRIAAIRVLKDEHLAEDITQDVFLELWKKREDRQINIALKAYLRRSVMNRCLNHIRDKKMAFEDEEKVPEWPSTDSNALSELEAGELEQTLQKAIDGLPERCRIIFTLSRFEDMKYKQIADQLGISIKTVENQMSKALRVIRLSLEDQ